MTIEAGLQPEFRNLRAISVVNDKFEGRLVAADSAVNLLRFYFRGLEAVEAEILEGDYGLAKYCAGLAKEIFGVEIAEGFSCKVAVWEDALPEFPEGFDAAMEGWRECVVTKLGTFVHFAGAAFLGAGLHVAASSGIEVSEKILKDLATSESCGRSGREEAPRLA